MTTKTTLTIWFELPMPDPNQTADDFQMAGPHRIRVELPDIVHVKLEGDVQLEHIRAMYSRLDNMPNPNRSYLLRDARRVGEITPKAREFLVKASEQTHVAAVVTFGSSFHARVLLTMVVSAVRVLRPSSPRLVFVKTEQDARAWIEEDRKRR